MTIVRTGSFCRAAEEMGCTQSGLTQMVNGLEKELGCRLLDRNYRGVTVSKDGRDLLPLIEQTVKDCHALKSRARALNRQTDSIRIGTFSSFKKVSAGPPGRYRFNSRGGRRGAGMAGQGRN